MIGKLFLLSIFESIAPNLASIYERCEGDQKLCYLVKIRKIIVEVYCEGLNQLVEARYLIKDGSGRDG